MSVRVSAWVWEHSPVQHRGDLLVLLVLADHAQDDGAGAYPSVDTIARKARLSERGARLALRNLEDAKAIDRTGRGPKGTCVYHVLIRGQSLPPAITAPGSGLPKGGQSPTENIPLTAPEPSLTILEPERGVAPAPPREAPSPVGDVVAILRTAPRLMFDPLLAGVSNTIAAFPAADHRQAAHIAVANSADPNYRTLDAAKALRYAILELDRAARPRPGANVRSTPRSSEADRQGQQIRDLLRTAGEL